MRAPTGTAVQCALAFFRNIVGARIARPQLVDISKLGLNSKIKKFSYSFICGKGYSPPSGGE